MTAVVLYGGSFEPPHKGHLHVLHIVSQELIFDKLLLIPNGQSPLKDSVHFNPQQKMDLLSLFINDCVSQIPHLTGKLQLCEYELGTDVSQYTVDTVSALFNLYPNVSKWYFVIGSDQLFNLENWFNIESLLQQVHLVVIQRHVYNHQQTESYLRHLSPNHLPFYQFKNVINPITATDIRRDMHLYQNSSQYLTPNVQHYLSGLKEG